MVIVQHMESNTNTTEAAMTTTIPNTGYAVTEREDGFLDLYAGGMFITSCGDWATVMQAIDADGDQ
jgi:hypothetical protein